MDKVKEPNEPERQIHSIMKRYVKNLMFNSCFFCLNVSVGKMAVSQKRPKPASKTGSRAACVDSSKHANKQANYIDAMN